MKLSDHFADYLDFLDRKVKQQFHGEPDNKLQQQNISKQFLEIKRDQIDRNSFEDLKKELLGAGPIENLLEDPNITEIMLNNFDQIYFEKDGKIEKHTKSFSCFTSYQNLIERICHEAGVELNNVRPTVSGHWRGFRLHMVTPPLTKEVTKICLRRNSSNTWDLPKLYQVRWCSEPQLKILKNIIKERKSALVIGPTNTGKTTCINACLSEIPETERAIIIEDTDELALPNQASVKLLTRGKSDVDLPEKSQQDLLQESLRMRPDRIIVGEVRGKEAKDFLLALSTGHSGCWCSLHADDPWQALYRLEFLVQMAEPQWQGRTVKQLINLGIDVIIHLQNEDGFRSVKGIYKLDSLQEDIYGLEKLDEPDHWVRRNML